MKNKRIDILDVLLILAKHKKFIFFTVLLVSIIAVIYSLLVTQYWISTAKILPSSNNNNSVSINSSLLGGFASSVLGTEQSDAQALIGIMKSRTFSLDVVNEFNLIEYFEIEESDSLISNEIAIKKLSEGIAKFGINEENGFLGITIETKDKYLSADIANFYWGKLDSYNKSVRMTKGKQQREFIEKRLGEVEDSIEALSQQLNNFQKENNTVDLTEQTKSIVATYSEMVSEKINNEIELEFSKQFFSESNQKIESLQIKNDILTKKIIEMEIVSENSKPRYLLTISDIPDLTLQNSQILLDLRIQQKVYEYLYPQYESAKIDELRDLPTIEIIDKAIPAGKRSRPRRAFICVFAFLMALIISSCYVILIEVIKEFLNSDHKHEKWENLKKIIIK
jgi:tyrosine-protein kinase Etk/Wzc